MLEKLFYEVFLRPLTGFLMSHIWIKKVDGLKNIPEKGPAILVANHCSYFDFLVIPSILKRRIIFMVAKELLKHPIIGLYARNDKCIMIDRRRPGIKFFKKEIDALQKGNLLLMFPEGTRSPDGKLLQWKRSFIELSMLTEAPIIPIAIKGTFNILPKGGKFPTLNKCSVYVDRKIYAGRQCKGRSKEEIQKLADLIRNSVARKLNI